MRFQEILVESLTSSASIEFGAIGGGILLDSILVCDVCAVVNNGGFEDDFVVGMMVQGQPNAWTSNGTVTVVRQSSTLWQVCLFTVDCVEN